MSFDYITTLFQSVEAHVEFANLADAMSMRSQGLTHVPFSADDQIKVAESVAWLYAADAAAQALCVKDGLNGPTPTWSEYMKQLKVLASKRPLSPGQAYLVDLIANLAWRSGQPFYGLKSLSLPVNIPFQVLEADKRKKARNHVALGAAYIRQWVQQQAQQAA